MMKRLSASVAVALAFGLCAAPAADAGNCEGGDPVYDPGSNSPCNFVVAPVMAGAEAYVHGRYFGQTPQVYGPSYLKDTADDGLDAYLWARSTSGGETREQPVARASGLGVTTDVTRLPLGYVGTFYLRVCVGEGATNCSDWTV